MKNAIESKLIEIVTSDSWKLITNLFVSQTVNDTKSIIIIMPAMGAHARPYRFMASHLANAGHAVLTVDPRGHGQSLPHPKRGIDYGVDDFLRQDIPAVLSYMKSEFSDRPVIMMGHSFGGHLNAMYTAENPDQVDALVNLTTTHVYFRKLALPSIMLFLGFTTIAKILGYVPGQHLGWGTPMAHRQVMDWAGWGMTDTFRGTDGRNMEPAMAQLAKPLLSIGFSDDYRLAPPAGIDHFNDLLPACELTRWTISPEDMGAPKIGHFGHLRDCEKLWSQIDNWILQAIQT